MISGGRGDRRKHMVLLKEIFLPTSMLKEGKLATCLTAMASSKDTLYIGVD